VVGMFSKDAHLIPLTHPFTTKQVARVILDGVVHLHGISKPIVSDLDRISPMDSGRSCSY
jgi:hypothetical protein